MAKSPTYLRSLQKGYQAINRELFAGALPPVMFVVSRRPTSSGHFSPGRWQNGKETRHEIAVNLESDRGRSPIEILSTVAHEAAHVAEFERTGKATRHHSRAWADDMLRIGLTPTATGLPGGRQTGMRITHMIDKGGAFEKLAARLIESGRFTLDYPRPDPGQNRQGETREQDEIHMRRAPARREADGIA